MSRIRRLACRLFGHPEDQQISFSMCDDPDPVLVICARCDATLVKRHPGDG